VIYKISFPSEHYDLWGWGKVTNLSANNKIQITNFKRKEIPSLKFVIFDLEFCGVVVTFLGKRKSK